MAWFGKVQHGKIVVEPGTRLTEGQIVRIEPVTQSTEHQTQIDSDPADRIGDDAVESGMSDLASQHDHCTYGTPNRIVG